MSPMRKPTSLDKIQLLLLDVDGVLTRGDLSYADSGEQIKTFNSKDGLGLRLLMDAGIKVGIVTGRLAGALLHRCQNLGIDLIFDGVKKKGEAVERISETTGIALENMAFMGDDLIDLPAMVRVGLSIAVLDASTDVQKHADIICKNPGGRGAVREVCEDILKAKNLWEEILESYLQ